MIETYKVTGTTGPVIVLMSGAGMKMRYWRKVAPALAKLGRVVTYDRPVPAHTSEDLSLLGQYAVEDLIGLLSKLGLPPPYVLIAHSIGGLYAQLAARLYPDMVAGIVFIDATHPRQETRFAETGGVMIRAYQGIARAWDQWFGPGMFTEVVHMTSIADEIDAAPAFPGIPLTIITAGKAPPTWLVPSQLWGVHLQNQRELAGLSPHSRQVFARSSDHNIPLHQPAAIVDAVRLMVRP